MRVNLLMADMESTKDTKFAKVIQIMSMDQHYALNQASYDDLNQTSLTNPTNALAYR